MRGNLGAKPPLASPPQVKAALVAAEPKAELPKIAVQEIPKVAVQEVPVSAEIPKPAEVKAEAKAATST